MKISPLIFASLTFTTLCVVGCRNINEPDPTTYPLANAKSQLEAAGVNLQVETVLYVNLDVNAYVVIAKDVKIAKHGLTQSNIRAPLTYNYQSDTGRFGQVEVDNLSGNRKLVFVLAATTNGESTRFESRFEELVTEYQTKFGLK